MILTYLTYLLTNLLSNFIWNKTPKRQNLLDALEKIPEIGKKNKSILLEMALEEFILKHGKSNNPQTIITMYDKEAVSAIPNIYEDDLDKWIKFYKILDDKQYDDLTERIEFLNRMHKQRSLL